MLTADLDITPWNVLLHLANIDNWSLDDINRQLDTAIKDNIFTFSGEKSNISASECIVQSVSFSSVAPMYVSEEVLLLDLGEAFLHSSQPPNGVGTPVSYHSPELILEEKQATGPMCGP